MLIHKKSERADFDENAVCYLLNKPLAVFNQFGFFLGPRPPSPVQTGPDNGILRVDIELAKYSI